MDNKRISSFKKFSELNETKNDTDTNSVPIMPQDNDSEPLLPKNTGKCQKGQDTRYMKPVSQKEDGIDYDVEEGKEKDKIGVEEKKVHLYGKVAKLPKGTQASKGLNFMENIKIPKNSIWYIMVEKQSNELQMLKYNLTKGVDLSVFVKELKNYYCKKYTGDEKLVKLIEAIDIEGTDKYSCIKNIPLIQMDGKKMITIITEDLIKLLSK